MFAQVYNTAPQRVHSTPRQRRMQAPPLFPPHPAALVAATLHLIILDSVHSGTYDSGQMKSWILSIGVLVLVTVSMAWSTLVYASSYSTKDAHSIVGKWVSQIRSNGFGITLEFFSDGTVRENSDFEKEGHYALKDNRFTTFMWDTKENREKQRIFDLRLDGDHITIKESNGAPEIQLERVCKGGSVPTDIIGEWFSSNYPGAIPVFPMETPLRFPVFVEFTHNKLFFRSTPIKSTQGKYEFSDGSLLLTFPDEPPFKSKPRVSSEQTDIRISIKGPEIPFRRVTGSGCAAQLEPTKEP